MKYVLIIICSSVIFAYNCHAQTIDRIVIGAYDEIKNKTKYNTEMLEKYFSPTYINGKNTGKSIYPNGDVNSGEGVCADLVVRALRNANIDLQKLVHLDILSNKKAYGVKVPAKYIDHRRVWILKTFFKRKWKSLSTKLDKPNAWQQGDMVIWNIGSKKHLHIGIIGKKKRHDGFPYVIHNMRYVPFVFAGKTIEQDILEGPKFLGNSVGEWKIIGHYRIK
ncbi:MAG: DUF1287 domain-containing protein [Desulfobacteraceae bacterium]|nr:DUF1287 domain-containing protein [Desulfobacteraceae bacterium]